MIEYNGEQHYLTYPSGYFLSAEKGQKQRDLIKINWCKENKIPLIIIKYNDFKDKKELENILKERIEEVQKRRIK